MRFRLAEVARIVEGTLIGDDIEVSGASIDSRSIEAGQLFVPIVADRDGHDFIADATDRGAAAHLTSGPTDNQPAVRVDDTGVALRSLGVAARERLTGEVIGVTGSVGKTTTKDLLAAALGASRMTHASHRSFNNELGVPLTLVNAPAAAAAVVVEMGARGRGHIAELCAVARPTIGVVLAVGLAHTELFGDLEAVAMSKGELVEALAPSGTAVLNADDQIVLATRSRTRANVLTFGAAGDVRAEGIRVDEDLRPRFVLRSPWGPADVSLPSAGTHTVANALAAAAAALAAGASPESIAEGLASATISPWRMEVHEAESGALIINDAYNANPLSMHAAIDALLAAPRRRRIAVLGVMAELGTHHGPEHLAVGRRLAEEGIEVIAVDVPEYGGTCVSRPEDAVALLEGIDADTAVLLKGSRVAGLERLAELLR